MEKKIHARSTHVLWYSVDLKLCDTCYIVVLRATRSINDDGWVSSSNTFVAPAVCTYIDAVVAVHSFYDNLAIPIAGCLKSNSS